jgi:hypothetical protein
MGDPCPCECPRIAPLKTSPCLVQECDTGLGEHPKLFKTDEELCIRVSRHSATRATWFRDRMKVSSCEASIPRETPRLCRGGSSSLTFEEVCSDVSMEKEPRILVCRLSGMRAFYGHARRGWYGDPRVRSFA